MRVYAPVATSDDGEVDGRGSGVGVDIAMDGQQQQHHATAMRTIRDSGSDSDSDDVGSDADDGLHGAPSRLRRHSSRLVTGAPWGAGDDWWSYARSIFSARFAASSLRRCRSSLQRSCRPRRVCAHPWSSLRALFCLLLYVLLCLSLMCALLLHTPMGWQGLHQSQRDADADEYASLMRAHAAALHAKEAHLLSGPGNPSHSVAAALLLTWQMQLPPPPPEDVDVPVSPPLHPAGLILPRLPVAREPPPLTHTLPLDTDDIRNGGAVSHGAGAALTPSSPHSYHPLGPSFVVVTYVSSLYFPRLLNLLGSIHTWEPDQRVVVYDLGCTQEQVAEMQCMNNVEYYFKPLLIYDALQHASSVLCLDAGQEVRQDLRSIKRLMQRDGYFFGSQPSNTVGRKTVAQSFDQLGVSQAQYMDLPFCGAAMFGIVRSAPAYNLLAVPAASCALRPQCHAPAGSGRHNHNFDQSTYSILVYKHGMACAPQRQFREMDMSRCPLRHDRFVPAGPGRSDAVVLCMRRWHEPKPYVEQVRYNQACVDFMQRPVEKTTGARDDGRGATDATLPSPLLQRDLPANWMYAAPSADSAHGALQHTQSSHLEGDSPLVRCLRAHPDQRWQCRREIDEHQHRMEREREDLRLRLAADYTTTLVWAGLRMPSAYLLFALLALAAVCSLKGKRWAWRHGPALAAAWIAIWLPMRIVIAVVDFQND